MGNAPIEMIAVITDRHKTDEVAKILTNYGISSQAIIMAKGTADSSIGDIFGFGIIDKDVICGFCEVEKTDKVMKDIEEQLQLNKPHNGVVMTIPINAISSDLFSMFGFKMEGK